MEITIINEQKPVCIGIGLLALDVMLNGDDNETPQLFAGGSCGNVLSILAFFGWNSFPIARFSNIQATGEVLNDLKRWDIHREFVFVEKSGSTPIIIHRIFKDKNGDVRHKFEFKNPNTKTWFPQYKSIVREVVNQITTRQAKAEVFYLDRVSRAALDLAAYYKSEGAMIFFEPSSIKDDKQFQEALELCDIIKFSSERVNSFAENYPEKKAYLEIETLGSDGLRYRTKKSKKNGWTFLPTTKIALVADSAGAGDWCSAGIIHTLGTFGVQGLKRASIADIEEALTVGQLLGAANCLFKGARGMMYNLELPAINKYLELLKKDSGIPVPEFKRNKKNVKQFSWENLLKEAK
ncbi:MAG: PfkB family carbohydrate kinase [Chitinophagaceae bacterium]